MIRTLTLALAASALLSAPAVAGSVTVSAPNASPEQVSKAVWIAAQRACTKEAVQNTLIQAHRACVKSTYREAMLRTGDARLAALAVLPPS
jgi:hypothetical protein